MNTVSNATKILCYGDSNTWGWVAGKFGEERYDVNSRWPALLQNQLGDTFDVIEEALGARTTAFDDPNPALPLRNGLQTLPIILESHLPIDIVIFMLGAADCKERLGKSAQDIASGMRKLVEVTQSYRTIGDRKIQKIIIISPVEIIDGTEITSRLFGEGAAQKSLDLVDLYRTIASETGCYFLDANTVAKADSSEGIHLTKDSLPALANALASIIQAPTI